MEYPKSMTGQECWNYFTKLVANPNREQVVRDLVKIVKERPEFLEQFLEGMMLLSSIIDSLLKENPQNLNDEYINNIMKGV